MVNLALDDDNNSCKKSVQSTSNKKCNKTISYKTGSKSHKSGLVVSDSNQVLRIYHQNICGLGSKSNDLLASLYPTLPHLLCLSEHHLRQFQLEHITMDDYILGAAYSRQSFLKGGGLYISAKTFTIFVN
jgi:hypothetical protein